MLAQALEIEIETVLNQYKDLKDQRGYQRVVRNGYMPEREDSDRYWPRDQWKPPDQRSVGGSIESDNIQFIDFTALSCGRPGAWNN